MLKKLVASQVRIRVKVWQNCSIERGRIDREKIGRLDSFRVRREEDCFLIDLKFKDNTTLQVPPMSEFAKSFYGMTNGQWAPDDAVFRIDPAPRLWERWKSAYARIFDDMEDA